MSLAVDREFFCYAENKITVMRE